MKSCDIAQRAVGMETSIEEERRKEGKKKGGGKKRPLFTTTVSLSLSLSVAKDGSKASRDSAAYWWPDIPYASTRSKEDVSRGS